MERPYLNEADYRAQYIENDFHKSHCMDSIIVDDFFSDDDIAAFEEALSCEQLHTVHDKTDPNMLAMLKETYGEEMPTTAYYLCYKEFYTLPDWKHLVDILQPKLDKHLGEGLYASHIHVLDSYIPYGMHTDAEQPNLELAPKPAWTLIIPLDDYDSTTYVFNERSSLKEPWHWVHEEGIEPGDYSITREQWERDFAPFSDYELFRYLTIESTFKWKKGAMFAADRFRFHTSDNFLNHGLRNKRALILWTSTEDK